MQKWRWLWKAAEKRWFLHFFHLHCDCHAWSVDWEKWIESFELFSSIQSIFADVHLSLLSRLHCRQSQIKMNIENNVTLIQLIQQQLIIICCCFPMPFHKATDPFRNKEFTNKSSPISTGLIANSCFPGDIHSIYGIVFPPVGPKAYNSRKQKTDTTDIQTNWKCFHLIILEIVQTYSLYISLKYISILEENFFHC